MKILYIANIRLPTEKAHGYAIFDMCRAFEDLGHEVTLLVAKRKNTIFVNAPTYYSQNTNIKIKYLRVPDLILYGKMGFVLQNVCFSFATFIFCLLNKFDLIYSRNRLPIFILSSFSRSKLFLEIHQIKKSIMMKYISLRATTIYISGGLKEFYSKFYNPKKYSILPSGISQRLIDWKTDEMKNEVRNLFGIPQNKYCIGYVGKYKTMGIDKGLGILIDAFSEVLKSNDSYYLLIAGVYDEEVKDIREKLKQNNIKESNYLIASHCSQEIAWKYLVACDVLVMPYPKIEHYDKYMSPLKLFEYMAVRRPIICSDLQSIREILDEDSATFFVPNDHLSLFEKILNLSKDQGHVKKKVQRAYLKVKQYTWRERAIKIIELANL